MHDGTIFSVGAALATVVLLESQMPGLDDEGSLTTPFWVGDDVVAAAMATTELVSLLTVEGCSCPPAAATGSLKSIRLRGAASGGCCG